MSIQDVDTNNCEIRFLDVINIFQGKITVETRTTIYDKLSDEEFIIDPLDDMVLDAILRARLSCLGENK